MNSSWASGIRQGAAAAAVIILAASGCTSGGDTQAPLVVAVDQTISDLNPLTSFFSLNYQVADLMYTPLIRYSADDFAPTKGLATKWTHSGDRRTWTYTIRSGVTWSDGKKVTADDARFTLRLLMDDKKLHASHADLVDNFTSVAAPDASTLVVKIKRPSSQMTHMDVPIVPRHVWSKIHNPASFNNTDFPVVGSGPFLASDFKVEEYIKFKANDSYWEGAPKYKSLAMQYYKTPDAAVQALRSGDVDLTATSSGLNPAQYDSLKGATGVTTNRATGRSLTSITFNVGARAQDGTHIGDGHPALRDATVRRALAQAIDKKQLIDKVKDGMATPGVAYIPPIFADYFWDPGDKTVDFDIDAANKLLDDAGYRRGSDGIRAMPHGGKKLEFRLLYHSDTPSESTIADFLKGWWKRLGIAVDTAGADGTKLNDTLYAGKFDVIFSGWGVDADPTGILALYTCDALPESAKSSERDTDTFYCDATYDKLFAKQKAETDATKRADEVKKMQQILYRQAPEVTLYYSDRLEAYRSDRWDGFDTQPAHHGMITAQQGVWGYYSARPVAHETGTGWWAASAALVAVVVVVGAVWWRMRRRAATADERE